VIDCDLPDCLTEGCGGDQVQCTRTCDGGAFGTDVECAAEDEIKTLFCPLLPGVACGMFHFLLKNHSE
jgi:hypothetical protein